MGLRRERASDRTSLTLGPGDRDRARLSDLDLVWRGLRDQEDLEDLSGGRCKGAKLLGAAGGLPIFCTPSRTTDIGPGGRLGGSKLAVPSVIGSGGLTSLLGLNVGTMAAGARGGGALAAWRLWSPAIKKHIVWHGCNSTCRKWKMENGKPWQHTIRKGQLYKYQRVIRFQWLASWMNVKNMSVEPGCLYRNWKLKYRENTASKLSLIRPTSKSKCCIAVSSTLFFWRLIVVSEEGPKAFVQE